jgi:transcriptional regulator GlxA family with amidase domain
MSDRMCPICGGDLASIGPNLDDGEEEAQALAVARHLVALLERSESRSRPDRRSECRPIAREPILEVQQWIREHLRADLSVAELARRAGMSQRNFARAFVQDTQMTPAQFVELLRVDAARRLLEESTLPLQRIAFESGFSGAQALRRAFWRRLGVAPREHRFRTRRRS